MQICIKNKQILRNFKVNINCQLKEKPAKVVIDKKDLEVEKEK